MTELISILPAHVAKFVAWGQVMESDYQDVLIPIVESRVKPSGKDRHCYEYPLDTGAGRASFGNANTGARCNDC